MYAKEGMLTADTCTFRQNYSQNGGGAMLVKFGSVLTLQSSSFISNSCQGNAYSDWNGGGAFEGFN